MLLELSDDQEFFRETTARFLDEFASIPAIRALRHDPLGRPGDFWRRGAELGWTSLLVSEANGGGSISGVGLADLTLVAYEFGRRAAPGPLVPSSIAAALLSRAGGHDDALAAVLAGTSVATWCVNEPHRSLAVDDIGFAIVVDGDELVLNGVKKPVEAGCDADLLLVTGCTDEGLTNVVVPAGTNGVTVSPLRGVDLTRRYAKVTFDKVRLPLRAAVGSPGACDADVSWAFNTALVLSTQESVGAMQSALDMTVEWSFDRYSFGRPLASYQALKHRFADMTTWLQAGHAIADEAAIAVASEAADASQMASAASAFVHHYGSELMHDCVQIHGGIGVTFEHDLHLFMRRLVANRATYGTPAEHHRRVGDSVVAEHAEVAA